MGGRLMHATSGIGLRDKSVVSDVPNVRQTPRSAELNLNSLLMIPYFFTHKSRASFIVAPLDTCTVDFSMSAAHPSFDNEVTMQGLIKQPKVAWHIMFWLSSLGHTTFA